MAIVKEKTGRNRAAALSAQSQVPGVSNERGVTCVLLWPTDWLSDSILMATFFICMKYEGVYF